MSTGMHVTKFYFDKSVQ